MNLTPTTTWSAAVDAWRSTLSAGTAEAPTYTDAVARSLEAERLATLSWNELRAEAVAAGVPVRGGRAKLEAALLEAGA